MSGQSRLALTAMVGAIALIGLVGQESQASPPAVVHVVGATGRAIPVQAGAAVDRMTVNETHITTMCGVLKGF